MLKEISVLSGKNFSYGFIHAQGRYILYNCIYFNTILMSPMYCLSLFSLIQTFSNLFLVRLNLISSCKIARQQIMLKYQFICVFDFSLILFGVKKRVFLLVYKWNYWMFILAMGFGLVQFLDKNLQDNTYKA